MLGKVVNRGVFTLERPLTIVEAVARAKGLETGLLADNRSMVDLADLQRSFVLESRLFSRPQSWNGPDSTLIRDERSKGEFLWE